MSNQKRDSHTVEAEAAAAAASVPCRTQLYDLQERMRTFDRLYHSSGDYSLGAGASPFSDLQTLESSFGRLGVSDSSPRQQPPLLDNRRNNQLSGRVMNGRGNWFPPNSQQDIDREQRLWFQKDNCGHVYDARKPYDYDFHMRSGSVMGLPYTGNIGGEVPFSPRNPYLDQSPRGYANDYVSGYRNGNGGGSVYNPDPYIRNNSRASILSGSKNRVETHQLQEVITEASSEGIDKILDNGISNICELMLDPFGHHVFQKLLEKCTNEQITRVLDMVIQQPLQFVRVCVDSHGYSSSIHLIYGLTNFVFFL